MQYIAGTQGAVQTSKTVRIAAKNGCTVVVEGPYSALEAVVPEQGDDNTSCSFCPSGMYVESATLDPDGIGGGKLSISCLDVGNDSEQTPAVPTRITYSIEMVETQYELKDHPKLEAGRKEILMWLATDENNRVFGNSFKYMDADGNLQTVNSQEARKFCQAYMHGIQNFVRYYPVITKTSYYRRVPGMTLDGISVSGGSPTFTSGIGTFDSPGITLSGYAATGWFKSKDSWQQAGDLTWTRNEQWTWTPDGSTSNYAWIYNTDAIQ